MPITTIPLVSSIAQRALSSSGSGQTKDTRLLACFPDVAINSVAGEKSAYILKRPGETTYSTPAAGESSYGVFISATANIISAFTTSNTTPATIYLNTTSIGVLDAGMYPLHFTEAILGGITYVIFTATTTGTAVMGAWFYASDAISTSFTGNRTSGSAIVSSVSSISGLYVGQKITATGFVAGTRIQSIDSATQVTMTNAASSGAPTNTTFTNERIAKIIDSDFPSDIVGPFSELNGRFYIMTDIGRLYGSELNTPVDWAASNYVSANRDSDHGAGCARYQEYIVAFGRKSIEFYRDNGNPSGSVLSFVSSVKGFGALFASSAFPTYLCSGFNNVFWIDYDDWNLYTFDGFSPKLLGGWIGSSGINLSAATLPATMAVHSYLGKRCVYIPSIDNILSNDRFYYIDTDTWVCPNFSNKTYISNKESLFLLTDTGTSGKLLQFAPIPSTFTDNGAAYTMTIQTPRYILNQGKGFIVNNVSLLADNQASGTTTIEMTKDDYGTWPISYTYDMTTSKKILYRFGRCTDHCAFRLTHSANTPWRGTHLVVDWEPCST